VEVWIRRKENEMMPRGEKRDSKETLGMETFFGKRACVFLFRNFSQSKLSFIPSARKPRPFLEEEKNYPFLYFWRFSAALFKL
jgi:hypothetical protein